LPAVEDHGQSKELHTFFGAFADSNRGQRTDQSGAR
jgi:hypothetical protein